MDLMYTRGGHWLVNRLDAQVGREKREGLKKERRGISNRQRTFDLNLANGSSRGGANPLCARIIWPWD